MLRLRIENYNKGEKLFFFYKNHFVSSLKKDISLYVDEYCANFGCYNPISEKAFYRRSGISFAVSKPFLFLKISCRPIIVQLHIVASVDIRTGAVQSLSGFIYLPLHCVVFQCSNFLKRAAAAALGH